MKIFGFERDRLALVCRLSGLALLGTACAVSPEPVGSFHGNANGEALDAAASDPAAPSAEADGSLPLTPDAGVSTSQPDTGSAPPSSGPGNPPVFDAGNSDPSKPSGGHDASTSNPSVPAQLVNPPPGSKLFVGANFWNIDWQGTDQYFQSGVDFATTTNPWRPDLIADLAPYHVLRFMDWNQSNNTTNPQADWSTRKLPTQPQNTPVAFEWQIDLCNRAKKDYWVTIPWQAGPEFAGQLAELIYQKLDPSLRVYVEWANEVWNGGFRVSSYATQQGQSMGLPGSDPGMSYQVYQSVRAFAAFEQVFGKGNPRLVKVLAGQAAWTGPCEAQLAALQNATINPSAVQPDVFAVAPYLSGTSMQDLSAAVSTAQSWVQSNLACAAKAGLPLISYEGGTDSSAGDCNSLQRDPGMRALYSSYLDALASAGLTGPFMQYTHSGSCWGLKVNTGDSPESSPKYAGVTDWVAAHPAP